MLKSGIYDDWYNFKKAVEARLGLKTCQILDTLYAMYPITGENSVQFLLKVEDKCVRYSVD